MHRLLLHSDLKNLSTKDILLVPKVYFYNEGLSFIIIFLKKIQFGSNNYI